MNRQYTRFSRSLVRVTSLAGCALLLHSPGAFAAARAHILASPAIPNPPVKPLTDVTVSGRVTDNKGEGLPGVSVIVKGTTTGTSTGPDGSFTLSAPEGSVLLFSSIGYIRQEFAVTGTTSSVAIKLLDDAQALSDVVVVGYGEAKKETVTGAISTVNQKVFQDRGVVDNPLGALQGQVPGVVVTRGSAAPGRAAWNFQIRGQASVNGTTPLVIIDGITIPDNNALNSINPDDIESMSFLKDGAAAIYGARAAGGVVLITTKKAKAGKFTVSYDGSLSLKRLGLQPQLQNVAQHGQSLIDATTNDFAATGASPTSSQWYQLGKLMVASAANGTSYIDLTNGGTIKPSANPLNPGFGDVYDFPFFDNTWPQVLWGSALSTQHNLALSGRGEKSGYRVSLGFLGDGSQLKWGNNSNRRYNIRLTHDYEFSDKLRLDTNFSLERQDITQPTLIGSVLGNYQQPGFPTSTINGKPYAWGTQYSPNWQAELGGDNIESNTRIYTNFKLSYELVKNLHLVGQAGYNWSLQDQSIQQKSIQWYSYLETTQYTDNPTRQNSYYQRSNARNPYANLNAYLNYAKTFAQVHEVSATLGTAYERNEYDFVQTRTTYLANDNVPSLNLGIGDNTTKSNTETQNHYAIGSYFGRLNYAFNQKYLLEVNGRYDGSSKFNQANRWQLFGNVSGGWRISEEKFLKDRFAFVNQLKLRASYGVVGNQSGIGLYDYVSLLNATATQGATSSGFPIIGTTPIVIVSPSTSLVALNRTWERIENQNYGIDFGFLDNRLTGSFDYFIKNNRNMLLPQTYPAVLGATAPAANTGHLRTWGWEAALNWQDQLGSFGYSIGGTLTDNQNRLIDYGGANVITGYAPPSSTAAVVQNIEGNAIGSYYGLEYAGRIQTQAQLDAYKQFVAGNGIGLPTNVRIGDNMFADRNGDGKLTTADYKNLGRNDPRFAFGVTLGATWKGFDFRAIVQGVGERTIFRSDNWRIPAGSIFQAFNNSWVGNTWTPTNTDAYYPLLSGNQNGATFNAYNYQISDWSVQNGAYVRLKNVTLGYTIPAALTKRFGSDRVRIYYAGSDLWERTRIKDGWDPEATNTLTTANLERYPFFRLHSFGANITF